jgi:hypothetical protein
MTVTMKQMDLSLLPDEARSELYDFYRFLLQKHRRRKVLAAQEDSAYWSALNEQSLKKIWDNEEDDIYNELLKG